MTKTGFYSGSFDPVTLGHLDIIKRAAGLFDRLVIGVGVHHEKKGLFSGEERLALLRAEAERLEKGLKTKIEVVAFDGLVVVAAKQAGARYIVRGLRDAADFSYEAQMSGMNKAVAQDIETVFLVASPSVQHIAATFVRQIAALGGDVSSFVSPLVLEHLKKKFPVLS